MRYCHVALQSWIVKESRFTLLKNVIQTDGKKSPQLSQIKLYLRRYNAVLIVKFRVSWNEQWFTTHVLTS